MQVQRGSKTSETVDGVHAVRPLKVEYCGEWYTVEEGEPFTIGRESDLTIDDNPYLHRTFLTLSSEFGLWWLSNVGQLLSATVSDATGSVQAWVAPGAKLPLVFQTVHVMFSAGATTYDFTVHAEEDFYNTSLTAPPADGGTTILPVTLTTSQRLLVVALAEHVLAQPTAGSRDGAHLGRGRRATRVEHDDVQPQARQRVREARQASASTACAAGAASSRRTVARGSSSTRSRPGS